MIFFNRYAIVLLSIFILAYMLPVFHGDLLSKRITKSSVGYSAVKEQFIKITALAGDSRKTVYSTLDSNETYTREEYQALFPFNNYMNLIKWDKFPKKFIGYKENISIIMNAWQFAYLIPKIINAKDVGLYPLYESDSKFNDITMPDEFFRFNTKMEFIRTVSNVVNKEKTKLFTDALLEKDFKFPMKQIFGNRTPMKPFDEGYFVVDNENKLFHIKAKKQKPSIHNVESNNMNIKFISIFENKRKEFYAIMLDDDTNVYLLMYDEYEFVKLPIDGFDYKKDSLHISTDPLHRHITIQTLDESRDVNIIKVFVTDLDYELVAKVKYEYDNYISVLQKKIRNVIFPFVVNLKTSGSYKSYIELDGFNLNAFLFNIFMLIVYLAFLKFSGREILKYWTNSILILFGGIYALISIFAFSTFVSHRKKL